ncbi:DUF5789 family protein [Haloarchaeobius sp. HRN-SO-5]|uniref:DUF5789 family protein n=1 Tax=Haloarchaeobius sp. HRN-SO-5 TaxID=3446118 RepID=UPI003EBE30F9
MTDEREQGVDFGDVQDELESETYPLSTDELVEKYGDRELSHANGTVTLGEVVEPLDEDYRSYDEVKRAVLTMVGEEAEGRTGYTDRGQNATAEDYDQHSF